MESDLKIRTSSEVGVTQYDISIIPNDFNITTIFNLIDSGRIEMPIFQRNYIWDKKRASKFIESLVGASYPSDFSVPKGKK